MAEYIAANGTIYTDEDIERWAEEAEAGWPGIEFGPSFIGPPPFPGEKVRPLTIIRNYLRYFRYLSKRKIIRTLNLAATQEEQDLVNPP